jgi:hypothetical protein
MKNSSCRILNATIRISLALTAICLSPITYAAPYTYEFTQSYSFNDSPGYFGTAAVVDVTVDNGNSSNASQTYTWNNILYLNITTIGGGFALSTAYPPDYAYNPVPITISKTAATDNTLFFNTDASGANAFFVPTSQNESFSQYRLNYYRQSISARLGAGIYYALDLYDTYSAPYMMGESIVSRAYVDTFSPNLSGVLVTPNPIYQAVVPIPASGWMLISGLIAIGCSGRKKAGSNKHIDQKGRAAINS